MVQRLLKGWYNGSLGLKMLVACHYQLLFQIFQIQSEDNEILDDIK